MKKRAEIKKYIGLVLSLGLVVPSVAVGNGFNRVYGAAEGEYRCVGCGLPDSMCECPRCIDCGEKMITGMDHNCPNAGSKGNDMMDPPPSQFSEEQDAAYEEYNAYLKNNPIRVSCPGYTEYDPMHANYDPRFDENNEAYDEEAYFAKVKEVQRRLAELVVQAGSRTGVTMLFNSSRSHFVVSRPDSGFYNPNSTYYRSELDSSSTNYNERMFYLFAMGFNESIFYAESYGLTDSQARTIPVLVSERGSAYYNTSSNYYDPELDIESTEFISEKYYAARAEFIFSLFSDTNTGGLAGDSELDSQEEEITSAGEISISATGEETPASEVKGAEKSIETKATAPNTGLKDSVLLAVLLAAISMGVIVKDQKSRN